MCKSRAGATAKWGMEEEIRARLAPWSLTGEGKKTECRDKKGKQDCGAGWEQLLSCSYFAL